MSIETTPAFSPRTKPQRRIPRYKLTVPLDLTVLRSGIPGNIQGRTVEIGEGGMGVVVGSQLHLGESVRVEFLLPRMTSPVRATAVVRYRRALGFGLQFLRLPVEQQSIIRYWTRSEGELLLGAQWPEAAPAGTGWAEAAANPAELADLDLSENSKRGSGIRRLGGLAVAIVVIAAMLGWWRWQQGWKALESQIPAKETPVAKPQFRVPAGAMRVRHQVAPEYPEDARQAGVQGTVVLDAVVSTEGAVTRVNFVSGPKALSDAAIDAVRWWRYEPYLVNGQPATVETTVAVAFRLSN